MAGGKETPRQRMIGILYLVLLGLIALNVPESLMDAFKNITNSLNTSRANVDQSLKDSYKAFEKSKLQQEGERAQAAYKKAKEASAIADELNGYIESLKKKLVDEGGGINPTIDDVNARDNLGISPDVMINQKNADVLRQKIDETRTRLLNLLGEDKKGVNFSLNTEEPVSKTGSKKNWQQAYFGDGIPLGAALTTLAKVQADNKNAENEVVKKILGNVDKAEINLDQFKAVIVAPSSYILQGQPFTADVFLTAYDKNGKANMSIDGHGLAVSNGVGKYSQSYGEGTHKFTASISAVGTDGKEHRYDSDPFTLTVARPSATVSATKMNVLYIGVPNPISVSAAGVPKTSLHATITGGSLTGSGSDYVATVKSIGTAKVTVSGDKGQVLGFMEFRTKRIPPPHAVFAGEGSGTTSAANIRAQDRIFARLDNFDFDAKFSITHYTLFVIKPRQDPFFKSASGNTFTADMKNALNGVTPGTTVLFRDITAVGPDGVEQKVDPIVLTAN